MARLSGSSGLGQGLPGIDAHPDQEHAQPSLQAVGNVDEDAEEQEDQDAEEEGALAGLPQDGGPFVRVIGAAQLARAQPGDDEEADEGAEEGEAERGKVVNIGFPPNQANEFEQGNMNDCFCAHFCSRLRLLLG